MNADTNGNYPVKKKRILITVLLTVLLLGAVCFFISRGLTKTEAIYLKALDEPVDIEPQEFVPFEREGFAVIEWGGAEVK